MKKNKVVFTNKTFIFAHTKLLKSMLLLMVMTHSMIWLVTIQCT